MSDSKQTRSVRSQNVTVTHESLVAVREQVAEAYDNLEYARHTEVMLRALRHYLESQDTDEAHRANLFLSYWLDVIPETLDTVQDLLDKAHAKLETFTASAEKVMADS